MLSDSAWLSRKKIFLFTPLPPILLISCLIWPGQCIIMYIGTDSGKREEVPAARYMFLETMKERAPITHSCFQELVLRTW